VSKPAIDALSPLAVDVKKNSPDRYLATLFAPPERRDALWALYAFDHEIARVQHVVSEPMAGLIRLQWWQDVIDGLGSRDVIAHPVVRALDRAVRDNGLNQRYLTQAIDARRQPFENGEPPTVAGFEAYLGATGGHVAAAAADLLGVDDGIGQNMAHEAGLAYAAWDQYQSCLGRREERQAWFPSDWLKDGDPEKDLSKEAQDVHQDLRCALSSLASSSLTKARGGAAKIERSKLSAFFPATLAGIRFGRHANNRQPDVIPAAPLRLFWGWLCGRF